MAGIEVVIKMDKEGLSLGTVTYHQALPRHGRTRREKQSSLPWCSFLHSWFIHPTVVT